jgi:hypothetical protein
MIQGRFMRNFSAVVAVCLVAAVLPGCDPIGDPHIRPASHLPDGPVHRSTATTGFPCGDGTDSNDHGGQCPSAEQQQKDEKARISQEILNIHAQGH